MVEFKSCPSCRSGDIKPYLKTQDHFFTKEAFSLYKCTHCQLIFTNPRPEDHQLGKYYQSDKYLSHHASTFSPVGFLYKMIRRVNVRKKYHTVLKYKQGNKILDIGCGTGELLAYFNQKGWDTKGVEPDEQARSFAQINNNIPVSSLDFLSETKEMFDVISMWHVLEHVSDLHERLQTVNRLLKDDGILVVALPNATSHDSFYYGAYWAGYDVPRHLYHFSPYSFKKVVEPHGFSVIQEIPMKFDVFYVNWLSEKYMNHRFPFIKGFVMGLLFNIKSKKSDAYSSKIYILKKRQ